MENPQNIRILQKMLQLISSVTGEIPTVIPDGIYGTQTLESVRRFQRAAELPVTGKVDEPTWERISRVYLLLLPQSQEPAALRIILKKDGYIDAGNGSAHTYLLQAILQALSAYYVNLPEVGEVSGIYNRKTEESVKVFQRCCRLPETGKVDRNTWNLLVSFYRLTVGDGNS